MQIDVQTPIPGQREQAVQRKIKLFIGAVRPTLQRVGDPAQNTPMGGGKIGKLRAKVGQIAVHRRDGDALQIDPVSPVAAQVGKHGEPGHRLRHRHRVQMRADRRDAVRIRAVQPELHPQRNVLWCPARPVINRQRKSPVQRAVRVDARDDMALVQMGVHIHKGRPDLLPGQIDQRSGVGRGACGRQGCDAPAVDGDVQRKAVFPIGWRPRFHPRHKGSGHLRRGQGKAGSGRDSDHGTAFWFGLCAPCLPSAHHPRQAQK